MTLALALSFGGTQLYAKRAGKSVQQHKAGYAGWYSRIKVYATTDDGTTYSHTTAGVFGKLKQSRYKKDRHDIPSYGTATLQVVFPHYNWGEENSGDYWSDYRKFTKNRVHKRVVYTFLVRNQKNADLSNASLKIVLDPAKNVNFTKGKDGNIAYEETGTNPDKLKDFTLVDVDNHQTYAMDELEYADLSMDGKHTRTFRLVRGRVKSRDFKPLRMPQ